VKVPVEEGLTSHLVSSVAPMAEGSGGVKAVVQSPNKMGEAYTEKCAGRKGTADPENWHSRQLRNQKLGNDEGINAHRSQHRSIRIGKDVKVPRSQKVVACT
jgi:hypothetical protein